jgi:redox-sensitive bicupin YhaK (pirin superfamily)
MNMEQLVYHPAAERGAADHGWLKARHSFSFASFYDPARMGFGFLRVLNDDQVAPQKGFGTHPHRNMEIITVPFSGLLAHKDSKGNAATIAPGEVQVMSAGSGIAHSEFNASESDPLKLLQIWIEPATRETPPAYQQQAFDWNRYGQTVLVSPTGDAGLDIKQRAWITLVHVAAGQTERYATHLGSDGGVYAFVIEGEVTVAGKALTSRDALGVVGSKEVTVVANSAARVLLIEVGGFN